MAGFEIRRCEYSKFRCGLSRGLSARPPECVNFLGGDNEFGKGDNGSAGVSERFVIEFGNEQIFYEFEYLMYGTHWANFTFI